MGVDCDQCVKCKEVVHCDYIHCMSDCPQCRGFSICDQCITEDDKYFMEIDFDDSTKEYKEAVKKQKKIGYCSQCKDINKLLEKFKNDLIKKLV